MARSNYADLLANAFASISAWRFAALAMACVAAILALALAYASLQAPAYLVPYEFATMKGPVKVTPGKERVNPDYLATVALGDLSLITTFHPDNVGVQYARFLNRATPELYSAQNVRLTAEAQDFAQEKVSQTFYAGATKVAAQGLLVEVQGSLVRWSGDKEVLRTHVVYHVTYKESRGMLSVDDISIRK